MSESVDTKRVKVTFSGTAYETLANLADQTDRSIADVLRDAIALEEWVAQIKKDGHRLLIHRQESVREVVVR